MAIQLLRHLTSIEPVNDDLWSLVIEFELAGLELRSKIHVQLDREMIPEPPEVVTTGSLSASTGGIAATATYSSEYVSREERTVSFSIQSLKILKAKQKINSKKAIKFRWATPGLIPDSVGISITITNFKNSFNFFGERHSYELKGTNAKRSLIDLLVSKPESHFFFPRQLQILEMSLPALSKISAALQEAPDTTGLTVTWPTETDFWSTSDGKNFLATQIAKYVVKRKTGSHIIRPIRLALCPFSLGTSSKASIKYIRELEIQSRLDVRVGIVTPETVYNVMRSESKSVSAYGEAVGFLLEGYDRPYEEQRTIVYLSNEMISATRERFECMLSNSVEWNIFRNNMNLIYSPAEEDRISVRVAEMGRMIQSKILEINRKAQ